MCELNENLKLSLSINDKLIYSNQETINESTIISTVKHIRELLLKNEEEQKTIKDIFEIMVEVMQNILNYSYGNVHLENNKKEAKGSIIVLYNTKDDQYTIQSCNLITKDQKEVLHTRLKEVEGLDKSALRKLARVKMRSRHDNHDRGAGLGLIVMAQKVSKPIKMDFKVCKDPNLYEYMLTLIV